MSSRSRLTSSQELPRIDKSRDRTQLQTPLTALDPFPPATAATAAPSAADPYAIDPGEASSSTSVPRNAQSVAGPSSAAPGAVAPATAASIASLGKVTASTADISAFLAIRAPLDHAQHLALLQSEYAATSAPKEQSTAYLRELRARKRDEAVLRAARERERKKTQLEHEASTAASLAAAADRAVVAQLARTAKHERRLARQLQAVRREKDVIRRNRALREAQYREQRERDYRVAIDREWAAAEGIRAEYMQQTDLWAKQYHDILDQKALAKREKHAAMARAVVADLVDLTIKTCEYRLLNNGSVPPALARDWKTLFLHSKSVLPTQVTDPARDKIPVNVEPGDNDEALEDKGLALRASTEVPKAEADAIAILDRQEFEQYLDGKDAWKYVEANPDKNHVLGTIVSHILSYSLVNEDNRPSDPLPALPLKICMLGKTCSGKNSMAAKLASKYDLTLVHPNNLVVRAVKAASQHKGSIYMDSTLQALGLKAQEALLEGRDVDDATLVGLICYRLRQLTNPGKRPTSPGPAGAQPVAPGGSISNPTAESGWILIDFPRTRTQAQVLEKALSGYEEAKPIKPGNIKRLGTTSTPATASLQASAASGAGSSTVQLPGTAGGGGGSGGGGSGGGAASNSNSNKAQVSKRKSMIALDSNQPDGMAAPGPSCFDSVMLLDVSNEEVFKRAAARAIDRRPATTTLTPTTPAVVLPRPAQQPAGMTKGEGKESQLQLRINAFEEEETPLIDWFTRFGTFSIVDTNVSFEEACNQVENAINEVKARKARAAEEAKAAAEAAAAAQAAATGSPAGEAAAKPPASAVAETKMAEERKPRVPSGPKSRSSSARERRINSPESPTKAVAALVVDAAAPATQGSQGVLAPGPSSTNSVTPGLFGPKEVSPRLLHVLADEWAVIETTFTNSVKYLFRCLRRERELLLLYFHEVRRYFEQFVYRPDSKQELIRQFQVDFNSVEEDLRYDPDTKAELHHRTEDLRDKLWAISDERKEIAENERTSIVTAHYIEDHYLIVADCYVSMMQCELDRFIATRQVLLDYARDTKQAVIEEAPLKTFALPRPVASTNREESILKIPPTILNTKRERPKVPPPELTTTSLGPGSKSKRQQSAHGMLASTVSTGPGGLGAAATAAAANAAAAAAKPPEDTSDTTLFADLYKAVDAASGFLAQLEEEEKRAAKDAGRMPKGLGVATKGVAASVMLGAAMSGEEKAEPYEHPQELQHALKQEDVILRARLNRILHIAVEHLREVRNRAIEVFTYLDDCVGNSFLAEMAAIKSLVLVVKQAVELEVKLPNELVLKCDQFMVNYDSLTYEPEPPPRPQSPIEKLWPDKFTVQQLSNLVVQLRTLAGEGFLPIRHFTDFMTRMGKLPNAFEYLPDNLAAHTEWLTDAYVLLDPHGTGYVSWKKFIVFAARILPAPWSQITDLKLLLQRAEPMGLVSREAFMCERLWFETEDIAESSRNFNRSLKIKTLLFDVFALPSQGGNYHPTPAIMATSTSHSGPTAGGASHAPIVGQLTVDWTNTNAMDMLEFALTCCCDPDPLLGLRKAFHLFGGALSFSDVQAVLSFQVIGDPIFSASQIEDIFAMAGMNKAKDKLSVDHFVGLGAVLEKNPNIVEGSSNAIATSALGAASAQPTQILLFQYNDDLMPSGAGGFQRRQRPSTANAAMRKMSGFPQVV